MKNSSIYMLLAYALTINLTAYFVVWKDKRRAKNGMWRISEKTIFLYALCGGFIGVWIAMHRFRHKTKIWYFVWGIPAIAILWFGIIFFIAYQFI